MNTELPPFNHLKRVLAKMGTKPLEYRRIQIEQKEVHWGGDGGDIEIDKVRKVFKRPDGLFEDPLFGRQLILYIRKAKVNWDAYQKDWKVGSTKMHLRWCKTLEFMHAKDDSDRYNPVDSLELDRREGKVEWEAWDQNKVHQKKIVRLPVCKNCLSELGYNGYQKGFSNQLKEQHVEDFDHKSFFSNYKHLFKGKHLEKIKKKNVTTVK